MSCESEAKKVVELIVKALVEDHKLSEEERTEAREILGNPQSGRTWDIFRCEGGQIVGTSAQHFSEDVDTEGTGSEPGIGSEKEKTRKLLSSVEELLKPFEGQVRVRRHRQIG